MMHEKPTNPWLPGCVQGSDKELDFLKGSTGVCDHLPTLHVLQHRKLVPLLRWSLHCTIHTVTGGTCENNWTPRFKKRRLHGELAQERGLKGTNIPKIRAVWVQVGKDSQQMCPWLHVIGKRDDKPMSYVAALHLYQIKLGTKLIQSLHPP